jgi:thiosulfate dehydrogenase [quinone] large subunit
MVAKGADTMATMVGRTAAAGRTPRVAHGDLGEPKLARWLFGRTESAWIWLFLRVYLGWQWLSAGWEKLGNPAWSTGGPLAGFIRGALAKSGGPHPDVAGWYATFLRDAVLPHAAAWAHLVAWGELLVGVALILGLFTGIAAFCGSLMNVSYLLAGTVSVNPVMFVLATWLVLAWRVAGWWGLDRWVLPALGTPWQPGRLLERHEQRGA